MKLTALGELFAVPVQSAVRAQSLALQEALALIERIGLEAGKVKTFKLKADRVVEERRINPATGESEIMQIVEPFEVSVPLLSILPLSPIQIQEMDIDFAVEIIEMRSEPIRLAALPSTVAGVSLAGSQSIFTPISQTNPTTMKVHMKLKKEIPEGAARVTDLLTDLLSGKADTQRLVSRLSTMPPEVVRALRLRGVVTLDEFLALTSSPAAITSLAAELKVSSVQIEAWRKESQTLSEQGQPRP